MHALLVSDIVCTIVQYLEPFEDRYTLSSLATTNRLFSHYALDRLWSVIYDFDGIIGCLPEKPRAAYTDMHYTGGNAELLETVSAALVTSMEKGWVESRFKQYASRVRSLDLKRRFLFERTCKLVRSANISTLHVLAQYGANFGPIFPNLVHLSYWLEEFGEEHNDDIAKIVQQHMMNELITFRVYLPFNVALDVESWINAINMLNSSSITKLQLRFSEHDDKVYSDLDAACAKAAARLRSLHLLELNCSPSLSAEISSIASLSHLSDLTINNAVLDTSLLLGTQGFPALNWFFVWVNSLSDLSVFVSAISSASLDMMMCWHDKSVQAKELQEFISILSQHNSRTNIRVVDTSTMSTRTFYGQRNLDFQPLKFMETYAPLKALPQLLAFSVPYTGTVYASTDEEFVSFMNSLPNLCSFGDIRPIPVSLPAFVLALRRFHDTRNMPVVLRPDFCLLNDDTLIASESVLGIEFRDVPDHPSIQELAQGLLDQFPRCFYFGYYEDAADETEEAKERGRALEMTIKHLRRDVRYSSSV